MSAPPAPGRGAARAWVTLLAMALAGLAGCGGATRTPTPEREDAPRLVVLGDAAATAVAAALVFPGSGWELPGTEGLTLLAAETLLEGLHRPLDELGAQAAVTCDRALFTFTLLAPPGSWERALDLLLDELFRPGPGAAALESARERVRESLSLDRASPAWQAQLAARQSLYGDTLLGSAWESPPCGVPESLDLFDLPLVRAAALRFAPHMTSGVALLGPLDPAEGRRQLESRLPRSPRPPVPSPPPAGPGRRYVERNTITAWTAHSFPFPAGADEEALRFIGALLVDELGPHISRPDVFSASYELDRHGAGGALIVHMVTAPAAAAELADRVPERMRALGHAGVHEAVRERVSRRHRGERLLARESPESRVAAMARALALGEESGDGWPDTADMTSERVRRAASTLGAGARAVVGPRAARPAVVP